MKDLENQSVDKLASLAKGTVGALPFIGPLLSEVVGSLIPNQRLDRVVKTLKHLEEKIQNRQNGIENLNCHLHTSEGQDIFEESLNQVARSPSSDRRKRLALFMAHSLSGEELKYAESKKLLNLFRELTDSEILWLLFYEAPPTMGSAHHKALVHANPEVLAPVSRSLGSSQDEIDRGALQDSYKDTLVRLGLLTNDDRATRLTALGELLIRYITNTNS